MGRARDERVLGEKRRGRKGAVWGLTLYPLSPLVFGSFDVNGELKQ